MIVTLIIVGLIVYVIASYVLMAWGLNKSSGPSGLGWLALPLAPLIPFVIVGMIVKSFFRRIFS